MTPGYNNNNLSNDALTLISNLNISDASTISNYDDGVENLIKKIQNITPVKKNQNIAPAKKVHKKTINKVNNDIYSNTSPFISSDMYNYIVNKNKL